MKRYLLQCDPKWKDYKNEFAKYAKPPRAGSPTIFIDLESQHWYGRTHWPELRTLMGAIEGRVKSGSGGDIFLTRGDGDRVRVQLVNKTDRGVGPMYLERPKVSDKFVTSYRHSVDAALLTPTERMCLFAETASKSGYLSKALAKELGALASTNTILVFAGFFATLFALEVVAGAVAAMWVARLFGVATFIADMKFYNREGNKLRHLSETADSPDAINDGALVFAGIYGRLVGDIATNLGITKIADFAAALMKRIVVVLHGERAATVVHVDPPKKQDVIDKVLNKRGVASSYIAHNGYARGDMLHSAPNPSTLEPAAVKMFKESCEKKLEAILIRDPGSKRMARIGTKVTAIGKPQWLKAKSKNGIDGVICLSMVPTRSLKSTGTVDLSHMKGLSPAMDDLIAGNPRRPAYKFPEKQQPIWEKEIGYDGPKEATGPKMKDAILVKIPVKGENGAVKNKLLILTKDHHPHIGDIDVAATHRPGTSRSGTHRQQGKKKKEGQNPEDDTCLEWKMNKSYRKKGGDPNHLPIMHGGAGASAIHVIENRRAGEDHWSPRKSDGSYDKEALYLFLPVADGKKIVGKCFKFKGWEQAEIFFKANHFQWPF